MKKVFAPIVGIALVALALAAVAFGRTQMAPMGLTATLNAGQEVPHPVGTKSGASGKFTATIKGTKVTWKLTFSHLTGAATAAHIHAGKKGVAGAVIVPLCGPCVSGAHGTTTVTSALVMQLEGGNVYVNVHTAKNPGGEIRGQLKKSM